MKRRLLFLIAVFTLTQNNIAFSQSKTDSLLIEINKANADGDKIKLMNILAGELVKTDPTQALIYAKSALLLAEKMNDGKATADAFFYIGLSNDYMSNYDTALVYHARALAIREKIGDNKGMAQSCNNMGIINQLTGKYDEAIIYYERSIEIGIKNNDKKNAAKALNNIGVIYERQGNLNKANQSYLKALKFNEETQDKQAAGLTILNLGLVQYQLGNYNEALKYYHRSKNIQEEIKDMRGLATTLNNLAGIFIKFNRPDSAEFYFDLTFKLYEQIKDKYGAAHALTNIGTLKFNAKNYKLAYDYYKKALDIRIAMGDRQGMGFSYKNVGGTYTKLKQFDQAEIALKTALSIGQELKAKVLIKEVYGDLATLYLEKKDYFNAHQYVLLYSQMKDSIFTEESSKQMAEMNAKYETEIKDGEIKLLNKDKEVQGQKQKSILIGLVLVLALAGVLAYGFYNKRRANILLYKQKNIIQEQKQEVEKQRDITQHQKHLIEEKQKEIIDSITYAKRIQEALLKDEEQVSLHLPEHFVLYKPKDIIAGDFYWAFEKSEYWYVAAADCTGHGVPGAMMSMLGMSFLNEIISSEKVLSTADILNQLRDKIVKEMRQTGKAGESKDGMDISLMRIKNAGLKIKNEESVELQWSGANNQLWYIQQNELKEITADKQPIGYYPTQKDFTAHTLNLQKGDTVYLMTDGYPDQFGGPKGKKYKYKQLEEKLLTINNRSLDEQKEILSDSFEEWKGNLEQVDDVTIIGIRI